MASQALLRELSLGVLASGGTPQRESDPFYRVIHVALGNYFSIKGALRPILLESMKSRRVKFIRVDLPRKVQLRLMLGYSHVATIRRPKGGDLSYMEQDGKTLGFALARYVNRDVEATARVLAAIERARKMLFRIAEESTRTLPA